MEKISKAEATVGSRWQGHEKNGNGVRPVVTIVAIRNGLCIYEQAGLVVRRGYETCCSPSELRAWGERLRDHDTSQRYLAPRGMLACAVCLQIWPAHELGPVECIPDQGQIPAQLVIEARVWEWMHLRDDSVADQRELRRKLEAAKELEYEPFFVTIGGGGVLG